MRRALVLGLFFSLALAGGLDFSLGVRETGTRQFLSLVGLSLDAGPLWFRAGVRFGAPNGILAEGSVAYRMATPLLSLFLGGGPALGLTVREEGGRYRFAVGDARYALFFAGLALPDRGYRPYLEAAYYLGDEPFARLSLGFVMEVF